MKGYNHVLKVFGTCVCGLYHMSADIEEVTDVPPPNAKEVFVHTRFACGPRPAPVNYVHAKGRAKGASAR